MQVITRAFSAIAVTTILGLTGSVFAATPAQIASQAYRGQLKGISGYQQLELNLSSGRITAKDVIQAAGETPSTTLERQVQVFLNDYTRSSN